MKIEALPLVEQYATIEEWANALTAAFAQGAQVTFENSDSLPIYDDSGRQIVNNTGLGVYDSNGDAVVSGNAVAVNTFHVVDEAVTAPKVLKNEIYEYDFVDLVGATTISPVSGTVYSLTSASIVANGGEIGIFINIQMEIERYSDVTFGNGPAMWVTLTVQNTTTGGGNITIGNMNLPGQPRFNATYGTTFDYMGFGTMIGSSEYTYFPSYSAGDTLVFRVKYYFITTGAATAYAMLIYNTASMALVQAQP